MIVTIPDNETELSRDLYEFDYLLAYDGGKLRLTGYHQQMRASKRHKWIGPCWQSHDERRYVSALDRPTTIPDHIIAAALDTVINQVKQSAVYIGWFNPNSRFR